MDRLRQDVRFATRSLIKSPLITGAAVVSLALGIGANASIFSAIDVFMIRPLDFEESDRLVVVWTNNRERGWTSTSTSVPDYLDWRGESRTLELAAYTGTGVNLSGGERPERLDGIRVSANFFDVLRKRPLLGRGFRPEEERVDGPNVVVLGDRVWRRSFGSDAGIIGRLVNLDGEPYEVIGVMPPRVDFAQDPDVWLPLRFTGEESRSSRFLAVLGRIRPAADIDEARTDLNVLQARIADAFPENAGNGATIVTLQDEWFDEGFRQGSMIAGTAVLFVLLIACANVANLLLARAAGRAREIALRTAVGAGKGRILRQLLTESMVLALAGGALGLALSVAGIRWIRGLFPPFLEGVQGVTLNSRVVIFTAGISMLAGLVFGIAPALRASHLDLRGLLTDANRGNTAGRGGRLRSALVVAEISLSVVLLIASVLLVQAFVKLRTADLGFRTDVITAAVTLPSTRYATLESVNAFQTQLQDRLAALSGVESVGGVHALPMQGSSARYYAIPEEPPPEPGREPIVNVRWVLPGYLETMGIRQIHGRPIQRSDARDAPPVVVINERMAASHWAERNPAGQRIRFGDIDHEIVGVVAE
ncbi:MAG: ADOP family duplicated permease, partial [Gemmatimonadetes bacterium]|nr:ADOP family duplicated permease [Gemmatimonadota bacterium]